MCIRDSSTGAVSGKPCASTAKKSVSVRGAVLSARRPSEICWAPQPARSSAQSKPVLCSHSTAHANTPPSHSSSTPLHSPPPPTPRLDSVWKRMDGSGCRLTFGVLSAALTAPRVPASS
eukprot:2539879-Rhodomonas_salina.1